MPTFRIVGEEWGTDINVRDGIVVETNESLEWALGFDWAHVKKYFDQYGYKIVQVGTT